jgi:hypothetical protein
VKLILPLFVLPLLLLPPAPEPAECRLELRLPGSGRELSLSWRQVGPELSAWVQPEGLDARGLRLLRVQSVLAFGGVLETDVPLKAGELRLAAGRHPLGFTIDRGDALRFFVVEGTEALPLPTEALEAGWDSPVLTLSLAAESADTLHLVWHVGRRAGRILLRADLGP